MIKVENIDVFNFEGAVRGMRNPLESWDKSDSYYANVEFDENGIVKNEGGFIVGPNDLKLMQRLYKAGPEHAKYLRQIFVCMDITAPLYWWKEFDTYKVGTSANSTSTMHKIHAKPLTIADFSSEHLNMASKLALGETIKYINSYIEHAKTDKRSWWQIIQLLPSSYNQKRTITMSYANIMNIISQRENHKLDCWRELCKILRGLPYVKAIRGEE